LPFPQSLDELFQIVAALSKQRCARRPHFLDYRIPPRLLDFPICSCH
jgi:hypothetical protein